jgi:hypothetical protein
MKKIIKDFKNFVNENYYSREDEEDDSHDEYTRGYDNEDEYEDEEDYSGDDYSDEIQTEEFKGLKIVGNEILGYEPFFEKDVTVATINNEKQEVSPTHGYYYPHKYGKITKEYANLLGYTFNNN